MAIGLLTNPRSKLKPAVAPAAAAISAKGSGNDDIDEGAASKVSDGPSITEPTSGRSPSGSFDWEPNEYPGRPITSPGTVLPEAATQARDEPRNERGETHKEAMLRCELEHQARYRASQARYAAEKAAKAEAREAAAASTAAAEAANDNVTAKGGATPEQDGGSGLLTYSQVVAQAAVMQEEVLGPFLRPGQISMLYGHPGAGKSFLALQAAVCVASGKPLAHEVPPKAAPVLLLTAEDSGPILASRLLGAAASVDADVGLLDQNLWVVDTSDPVLMFTKTPEGKRTLTPRGKKLFRRAATEGVKLIVLDPLVELHDLNESDNGDMGFVMATLRTLARRHGCAILVVHHLAKGDEQNVSVNSGRGAVSLGAAARAVRSVAALNKDDLKALGIDESEASDLFKVTDIKSSYSRRRSTPIYFMRENGRVNGFPAVRITHITRKETEAQAAAA